MELEAAAQVQLRNWRVCSQGPDARNWMVRCRGPKGTGNAGPPRSSRAFCHGLPRRIASALAWRRRIIGEFCDDFGVPKQMKATLIKKAKFVGSDLGFLS